ncbi:TPA: hypothetical protein KPJ62_003680 [Clostridioides difficile]|nr:hypothetical protein [Clostridioides difficile]
MINYNSKKVRDCNESERSIIYEVAINEGIEKADKDMDKKLKIIATIMSILIISFSIFNFYYHVKKLELESKLNEEIRNMDFELENKIINDIENIGVVDISKLVNFNFDKISIYPYNPQKTNDNKDLEGNKIEANFSYMFFIDKDNHILKKVLLNKKYDILGDRSYKEFSKKDSIFHFKKVINKNDIQYELIYK